AGGELEVVAGRAHGDGDGLAGSTGDETDFHRLLGREVIGTPPTAVAVEGPDLSRGLVAGSVGQGGSPFMVGPGRACPEVSCRAAAPPRLSPSARRAAPVAACAGGSWQR